MKKAYLALAAFALFNNAQLVAQGLAVPVKPIKPANNKLLRVEEPGKDVNTERRTDTLKKAENGRTEIPQKKEPMKATPRKKTTVTKKTNKATK